MFCCGAAGCPRPRRFGCSYQALLGLQHVHEQGLVHRDLEPANLMLLPDGVDRGDTTLNSTVKILDIGLGRAVFDEGAPGHGPINLTDDGRSTRDAVVLLAGADEGFRARPTSARTSIAWGASCTTRSPGQPPFEDRGPVRLMLSHASEPPPRLASLNLGVSDGTTSGPR